MTGGAAWTPMIGAIALGILWWPRSRVEYRLTRMAEAVVAPRLHASKTPIYVVIPLVIAVMGGFAAAIAAGIVAAVVWWRGRRRHSDRAADQRIEHMVRALSMMIAELSVGTPPAPATLVAVDELRLRGADSDVADELEGMAWRAELGGPVIDGAQEWDTNWGPVSWQRIGVAWQTAERHGLPMADLLGALRSDLLARRAFVDRTRAGLAGPRATAVVLAGLPILGLALGQATGAQPVGVLLGGGLGGVLLVVGTALAAAGLVWAERLTARVLSA